MAKLTEKQKVHVITRLAMFDTPTQVATSLEEEFGVTITRQGVQLYNPTTVAGKEAGKKWTALFWQLRAEFLKDSSSIAIANRNVRLRRLDRIAEIAERKGNLPLVLAALKQAAEDAGGAYTNRRELTGADGTPLNPEPSLDDLTDDELIKLVNELTRVEVGAQ